MSGERARSSGKKGLLSLGGHRKRNRTPSSSGSEARFAPRNPFRRNDGDYSDRNGSTPPSPRGLRSIGNHDEFLDDVRFDVAPKDMCIAASQGAANGDDNVVLQQMCSLGSVLAGGKGDEAGAAGAGAEDRGSSDPSRGDGNNSRGASRDDSVGGDNLLMRWLQPAVAAAAGQGVLSGSKAAPDGAGGCENLSGVTDGGHVGGAGGVGARVAGDWAKKSLRRKKLADAERGRKLRLRQEENASLAGCLDAGGAAPAACQTEASSSSATPSATMNSSTTTVAHPAVAPPASTMDVAEKMTPQGSSLDEKLVERTASISMHPTPAADLTTSVKSSSSEADTSALASDPPGGGGGGGGGGGTGIVVIEVDEYGDDFAFLTDADLQALEEEATKSSAASSQQTSQQNTKGNMTTPGQPSLQSTSAGWTGGVHTGQGQPKAGHGQQSCLKSGSAGSCASRGGGSVVHKTSTVPSRGQPMAGSKRPGTFGTRPPLSTLGPNPQRGDHRRHGSTPLAKARRVGSSGSNSCSQSLGSSQGGNRDRQQQRHSQGKTMPGRGEGASNARRTPSEFAKSTISGAKGEIGVGDASRRRGLSAGYGGGGASAAAAAAASAEGETVPKLFTTYGSMEDFTRSTAPGRQAKQGLAGAEAEKGQARLKDWTKQPNSQQPPRAQEASTTGTTTATTGVPSGVRPFVPVIVHRRFLVLEVTYASREKVLMALEQNAKASNAAEPRLDSPAPAEADAVAGVARQRKISLLGDWYDCEVEPGDVVHVLFPVGEGRDGTLRTGIVNGNDDEVLASLHVVVDNASGKLLVVQPDILVSPTKVADTVLCARKAALQSRLASDASKSKPAVLGNLKHELFETSLLAAAAAAKSTGAPQRRAGASLVADRHGESPAGSAASAWQGDGVRRGSVLLTSQYMAKLVDSIVVSQLEALYGAGLDEDAARRELLSVSGPILDWHRAFLAERNGGSAVRGGPAAQNGFGNANTGGIASMGSDGTPASRITVARVLATEDDVWCPVLGLKGIMDATVEAVVQPLGRAARGSRAGVGAGLPAVLGSGVGRGPLVMPVEVKTGKRIGDANSGHRAQVMLYTLLLRMRYGSDASTSGLLVYTSADGLHTELVSPVAAELRALVLARNRHATGMAKIGRVGLVGGGEGGRGARGGAALPAVIRRPRECGTCFQNSECMLYHRAAEGGDEESSGLERGVFDSKVGHLSEAHLAFFAQWDRSIDLEAKIGEQVRRTMWQESGPDRESRTNKCMSGLVWLGEREPDTSLVVDKTDRQHQQPPANGSKRFTHVLCREWAVPEPLLLIDASRSTGSAHAPAAPVVIGSAPANAAGKASTEAEGGASSDAKPDARRPEGAKPLTDLSLSVGDMVCVSAQGGGASGRDSLGGGGGGLDHVRLLTGNIAAVHEDRVEVLSDKRMRVPRRGGRSGRSGWGAGGEAEAGDALDIEDLLGRGGGCDGEVAEERVLFRIDKDEWAAGINMMRSNLVKLMVGPSPESEEAGEVKNGGDNAGDEKRRRLIVDLDPPRFGRFTGLLDVPGTLLGWTGGRCGLSDQPRQTGASGGTGAAVGGGGRRAERDAGKELEAMFRTSLNEDQRAAVRKLVTARDYALLLGMPGTGKTWTIAFAVRVLLARGASVLITSYTHSAVDNLLLKLIGEGVACLRVGNPSSVHPGVREHCVNYDGKAETTAAYSELVASARVVGCTCLGVKHPLFSRRRFDYCVVDEAGQISQPAVLAPLRCADVFVLVGDHYQLPPLVTSSEALEAGMSESLFRRLCEAHPASLQRLSYQYRMNGDVMALCNDLTYSGRLRCGNARVEDQRLVIPNLAALSLPQGPSPSPPPSATADGRQPAASAVLDGPTWQGKTPPSRPLPRAAEQRGTLTPWLAEVLDPDRRVIFLNTDAISPEWRGAEAAAAAASRGVSMAWKGGGRGLFAGLEVRTAATAADGGGRVRGTLVNSVECDVVRLLTWGLDVTGFDLGGVGVISPYRSQVQLLQAELKPSYPSLEINTIDKYQGRDKEVIVVSFVRSNAEGTVGHLLRDWRRLNVALSRAKHKLVLIGSLRTLSSCALMSTLTGILNTRGWVYQLPAGAQRIYPQGLTSSGGPGRSSGGKLAAVTVERGSDVGHGGGGVRRRTLQCGDGGSGAMDDGDGVMLRGTARPISTGVVANARSRGGATTSWGVGGGRGRGRGGIARQRSAD